MGASEFFRHDILNNMRQHTDRGKHIWDFTYNKLNQKTDTTAPLAPVVTVKFEENQLKATEDTRRVVDKVEHDKAGNISALIYDAFASHPRRLEKEYDGLNRETAQTIIDVPINDPAIPADFGHLPHQFVNLRTEYIVNMQGIRIAEIDANNDTTLKIPDNLGRIIYEIDQHGAVVENIYNSFNKVKKCISYANFIDLKLSVDEIKKLTPRDIKSKIKPDKEKDKAISFKYDKRNNPIAIIKKQVYYYANGEQGLASPITKQEFNYLGKVYHQATLVRPGVWAESYQWHNKKKQVIAELDALLHLTLYIRDAHGNVTYKMEFANPLTRKPKEDDNIATLQSYVTRSPKDRVKKFTYNKLDNCTSETDVSVTFQKLSKEDKQYPIMVDETGDLKIGYDYDELEHLCKITHQDGAEEFQGYDARGYLAVSTKPKFTKVNGEQVMPVTAHGVDAFGDEVMTRQCAISGTKAEIGDIPIPPESADDRIDLQLLDKRSKPIIKQNPQGSLFILAHHPNGKLAREFTVITDWIDAAHQANHIVEKRIAYGAKDANNHPIQQLTTLRDNIAEETTYQRKNAFGQTEAESDDLLKWKVILDYDAAGRLWFSNQNKGIDTIMLCDLANNQTLTLTSPTLCLSGYKYAELPSLLAMAASTILRQENRYNLLGYLQSIKLPHWYKDQTQLPSYACTKDRWNNSLTENNSLNEEKEHDYNHRSQRLSTKQPNVPSFNGTTYEGCRPTTHYGHSKRGVYLGEKDHFGYVDGMELDEASHPIRHFLGEGTVDETNHLNIFGEIEGQEDSRHMRYGYHQNKNGQVDYIQFPSQRIRWLHRDTFNNVRLITDLNSNAYRLNYDARENISTRIAPMGDVVTQSSDRNHLPIKMADQNGTLKWGRTYFGIEMNHTDLANILHGCDRDNINALIKEYTTQLRGGDRFYKNTTISFHPTDLNHEYPWVKHGTARCQEVVKSLVLEYEYGLLVGAVDHAEHKIYAFDNDTEARRTRMRVFDLSTKKLLYDVLGRFDSNGRLFATEVSVRTNTDYMAHFKQTDYFNATNDLTYQEATLDPPGYSATCRGALQMIARVNAFDRAHRMSITNGYIDVNHDIQIGNNRGAILNYRGNFRSEEIVLVNNQWVRVNLGYHIDGELSETVANNGTTSRRNVTLEGGHLLRANYTESSPNHLRFPNPFYPYPVETSVEKSTTRSSVLDANHREVLSEYWEGPGTCKFRSEIFYYLGAHMPYYIKSAVQNDKNTLVTMQSTNISGVKFDSNLPYYTSSYLSNKNVSGWGTSLLTYNSHGYPNGKYLTGDESIRNMQPVTLFESTFEGMMLSKENIFAEGGGLFTKNHYLLNGIDGRFLGLFAETTSGNRDILAHARFHLRMREGRELKPTVDSMILPLRVDLVGKFSLTPVDHGKSDPLVFRDAISPAMGEQVHIVKPNETFESIAFHYTGDPEFADKIIKFNGFLTQQALKPGFVIFIPQYIPNKNKSYQVNHYHQFMNAIQGSILPYIKLSQPHVKHKYSFWKILVGMVVVGLALMAAWHLAPHILQFAGNMGLISGTTAAEGVASFSAGTEVTIAAKIALSISTALTDAAAQGLSIALHVQDKFSVQELVGSTLSAGLGMSAMKDLSQAQDFFAQAKAILEMGLVSVETQLSEMLLNVREQFDGASILAKMGSMIIAAKTPSGIAKETVSVVSQTTINASLTGESLNLETMGAKTLGVVVNNEISERIQSATKKASYLREREKAAKLAAQDEKFESNPEIQQSRAAANYNLPNARLDLSTSNITQQRSLFNNTHPERFTTYRNNETRATRWNASKSESKNWAETTNTFATEGGGIGNEYFSAGKAAGIGGKPTPNLSHLTPQQQASYMEGYSQAQGINLTNKLIDGVMLVTGGICLAKQLGTWGLKGLRFWGAKEVVGGEEGAQRIANIERTMQKLEEYMGEGMIATKPGIKGKSDLILTSTDRTKKIRFDIENSHGLDPHVNVETFQPRMHTQATKQ